MFKCDGRSIPEGIESCRMGKPPRTGGGLRSIPEGIERDPLPSPRGLGRKVEASQKELKGCINSINALKIEGKHPRRN